MSLCPSLFTATCCPFAFLIGRAFCVLGHSTPQNYVEFQIVSFSGFKMIFSRLSLARYHYLHKTVLTITSIYVISCLQFQKGAFSYYVITQGPIFESLLPSFHTCSILVAPSPLSFERLKLNLNPSPHHPITIFTTTPYKNFEKFRACCNQPLQIQQKNVP